MFSLSQRTTILPQQSRWAVRLFVIHVPFIILRWRSAIHFFKTHQPVGVRSEPELQATLIVWPKAVVSGSAEAGKNPFIKHRHKLTFFSLPQTAHCLTEGWSHATNILLSLLFLMILFHFDRTWCHCAKGMKNQTPWSFFSPVNTPAFLELQHESKPTV